MPGQARHDEPGVWPGDWNGVNRDYANSRSNPIEFQVNPGNVAKLKRSARPSARSFSDV